ncbi:PREDICTED: ADP-ribose pyrophosphatase, mitochondrial [Cyphomyrmex costatus]|uniref:ADP-ribose pyrophosphatase, mitochondrial n=1 Tax=Cyphomyrmex costatus TaxID=456900 RepID=A0A151I828_9HYME|nr:PREDICTED: ADP-ribose pyrophosphatase, mitochondrial [Cyphomyrmex costatus]KYM94301.1 ADP-ribose pyrophosphatase, mitochondrial [Cyphomyrmex costatus]
MLPHRLPPGHYMNIRHMISFHQKCRQDFYPSGNVKRFAVPDEKISWTVEYPEYKPVSYTATALKGKPWADPEINESTFKPKWNAVDDKVNRKSFMGNYVVNTDGYPLNPVGRTGIIGRGLLGRWGPNHAADPIVTRWKRDNMGIVEVDKQTGKPVLQFVAIQRRDSGEWAIPGGMIDPNETVSTTLMREFMEEALNFLEMNDAERKILQNSITEFFTKGDEIYKGYVDDPRNTDNSWMETVAINFHDEENNVVGKLTLKAGDDARNVRWMDLNKEINLYANHSDFVKTVVSRRKAHW